MDKLNDDTKQLILLVEELEKVLQALVSKLSNNVLKAESCPKQNRFEELRSIDEEEYRKSMEHLKLQNKVCSDEINIKNKEITNYKKRLSVAMIELEVTMRKVIEISNKLHEKG